ncbi:MAG: hypothetical protein OES79_00670 [Planctomycetota bacterium]|nr:hypothetical protein [Planctomycetota bacterium]
MKYPLLCLFAIALTASVNAQESSFPPETQEEAKDSDKTLQSKVKEIAEKVDQDERAQEASSGILKHIAKLAELLSFPAFHWVAFAAMAAGVVSFSLQLVLAKFVVLTRMSLSLREIISDALGLFISLVGLVLTTQAATHNSSFAQTPASVLSATAVGAVVGLILYIWGQRQEVEAAEGRRRANLHRY